MVSFVNSTVHGLCVRGTRSFLSCRWMEVTARLWLGCVSAVLTIDETSSCLNPDVPQPIDFYEGWKTVRTARNTTMLFWVRQWELFFRYVALGEPFLYDLRSGAQGVGLAEAN